MATALKPIGKRKNFVRVGEIRIRWSRLGNGRTRLDLRKWRAEDKQPSFADHAEALAVAEKLALELNAGGRDSQALTSQDRASFAEAMELLQGTGLTLVEAVRAGRLALTRRAHPVPEVVEELIASRAKKDAHGRYKKGLAATWRAFAKAYPGDIREVTAGQIQAYVDGLAEAKGLGARTRDNTLREIRHIFRWAWGRKYLPDEINAARQVELYNEPAGPVTFYTPEQIRIFLENVKRVWLPYLAIACFAGIRPEEICAVRDKKRRKDALRWEDFDWENMEIVLRAETAKTGFARRVSIEPNLYAWLRPWREGGATGPVCAGLGSYEVEFGERGRLVRAYNRAIVKEARAQMALPGLEHDGTPAGLLVYHQDGFRHSYGGYMSAKMGSHEQVARLMGNSPAVVKRNYDNPRPRRQAEAYFAIMPADMPANVTQLTLKIA